MFQRFDAWLDTWWRDVIPVVGQAIETAGIFLSPLLFAPLLIWIVLTFTRSNIVATASYAAIDLIDRICFRIGEIVKWGLLLMVLGVTLSVVFSIFGRSYIKLDESIIYFHVAVITLGAAATFLADGHVSVDVFYSRLSHRIQRMVLIAGFYVLLLPLGSVIIYYSQRYVGNTWLIREGSNESTGLPLVFLLKTLVPLFAVMILVQGASLTLRAVLQIMDRPVPPRRGIVSPAVSEGV